MPEPGSRLSVIVVSFSRPAILERCLSALVAEVRSVQAEVLVVRRSDDVEALRSRFPTLRWIPARPDETVPRMRSLGLESSGGDPIALLEDDCVVAEGWCAALLSAHQGSSAAVGGPIEPGNYQRARDWGVFFCEYGRFMSPLTGEVAVLPGNNISYTRSALEKLAADVSDPNGFYETFANARLRRSGKILTAAPQMIVYNINSWSREWLTTLPYHHGRGYGGLRVAGRSAAVRLAFAALTPLVPALKVGRIAREVAGRGRYLGQFIRAFPWILLFAINWSAGEGAGYLFGPGRSLQHWR